MFGIDDTARHRASDGELYALHEIDGSVRVTHRQATSADSVHMTPRDEWTFRDSFRTLRSTSVALWNHSIGSGSRGHQAEVKDMSHQRLNVA